ncbi:hypothetical protein BH23PLA1_BH23PLA1_01080 [soil metagenome]
MKVPPTEDLRGRQVAFNASSRDQWEGFARHRQAVSALLGAAESGGRTRLCVLGVGNGNDLDLPALLAAHREVHLVDLDAEALARGVARQGVENLDGLHLHGGLDVTGMLDALETWSPSSEITPAALEALVHWPADWVGLALPGPFDRVASTCLLSQLINTAYQAIGEKHPRFRAVVRAIRTGHLQLLARLATPGGSATLITDVVSSEIFPPLATIPEAEFERLLPRLAIERKHIQGVHPAALLATLRNDPDLGSLLTSLETFRPWRWQLHARQYLVWAMRFRIGIKIGSPRFGSPPPSAMQKIEEFSAPHGCDPRILPGRAGPLAQRE